VRRLGRYIFNGLTVLALLVGTASAVMWVRSYFAADLVMRHMILVWHDSEGKCGWEQQFFFGSNRGQLYLARRVSGPYHFNDGEEESSTTWQRFTDDPSKTWNMIAFIYGESVPDRPDWNCIGFSYMVCNVSLGRYREIRIPFYALVFVGLGWPAVRIWQWKRRRRLFGRGRCKACGYDLRATPQAGGALLARCPECGRDAD
jgi:hypothetical protein